MTIIKKKLSSNEGVKYIKYAEAKPGETLVLGNYTKVEMVDDNFNPGKKVPKHFFETDEGTVVLNSSSDLNRILESRVGLDLEIVFLGKANRKNKAGQPYKAYEFEVLELVEETA